jgi:hypothetical protein
MADFNADGVPDVAVLDHDSREVSIGLQGRDGTWHGQSRFPLGGPGAWSLVVGDFNADGHLDVATVAFARNELVILLGDGRGAFQDPGAANGRGSSLVLPVSPGHDATNPRALADQTDGLMDDGEQPDWLADGFEATNPASNGSVARVAEPGAVAPPRPQDVAGCIGSEECPAPFLTSSGTVTPSFRMAKTYARTVDVFVVNGPGFSTEVEAFAQGDAPPKPDEAPVGCRVQDNAPGTSTASSTPRLAGRTDARGQAVPGSLVDESALNSFRMLLDAARSNCLRRVPVSAPAFRSAVPSGQEPSLEHDDDRTPSPPREPGEAQPNAASSWFGTVLLALGAHWSHGRWQQLGGRGRSCRHCPTAAPRLVR